MLIPMLLARIRIPIPRELAGPMMVLGAIMMVLIFLFVLHAYPRLRWSLAAFFALLATDLLMALALPPRVLYGPSIAADVVRNAILVLAVLATWGRTGKVDLPGAAIAAAIYAIVAGPLASVVGRFVFSPAAIVRSAVWALCLLGALALAWKQLKPAWLAVLAGAAGGSVLGSLLVAATMGRVPDAASLARVLGTSLVLGAMLAGACALFGPRPLKR